MSRKLAFLLTLVALLALSITSVAFATSEPVGKCPSGFELEEFMPHEHHHHLHVGLAVDLNGDGFICMRPVTPESDIHVHVDNYLP